MCRPQFRRTQRASGLRLSRRSPPRGLHGPDRELDRYAPRSASAGGCRKSAWLTAASRRLPDRRVQNVWSVTVYVRSVLVPGTVELLEAITRLRPLRASHRASELSASPAKPGRAVRQEAREPSLRDIMPPRSPYPESPRLARIPITEPTMLRVAPGWRPPPYPRALACALAR